MAADPRHKIGELATELDDLAISVEELQAELPPGDDVARLESVRAALEQASDTTDEIISDEDE